MCGWTVKYSFASLSTLTVSADLPGAGSVLCGSFSHVKGTDMETSGDCSVAWGDKGKSKNFTHMNI